MSSATRRGSSSTTRLRKAECARCGYVIRVARSWLGRGLPTCACGGRFTCPDPADREWMRARDREAPRGTDHA
jgi:hypothetical protein